MIEKRHRIKIPRRIICATMTGPTYAAAEHLRVEKGWSRSRLIDEAINLLLSYYRKK